MFQIALTALAAALLATIAPAAPPPAPSGSLPLPADLGEIIFATRQAAPGGHWYENFGYAAGDASEKLYRAMGRLCRFDPRTGKLTLLIDDPAGTVRDPQVHYDGRKILFSYRPGGTEYFHLYEIDAAGGAPRQLTDGPFDDLEASYLPDGHIIFCSSRCRRWVNCWSTQVANLHVCDSDGGNITPLSANIEQDNTPWPLPDGRVIYTRWEYVDRSRVSFHHLWTANPDGTDQMIYFGNQTPGTLMIDAKPIPGTADVVAIFSPGHGKREHAGAVTIVTPKRGPDDPGSARRVSAGEDYRDPYPLSADALLVAQGSAILLMNAQGETRTLYKLPPELAKAKVELHEPRPLAPRRREPLVAARTEPAQATGRMVLANVALGRNMEGVKPGEVKQLLVLETLPKPINDSGKMPPMSYGGTYTLNRILGTVPVESDGSAYFELPALRSIFFVALDGAGNSVQRMLSFTSVEPGETLGCAGCHEHRTRTPPDVGRGTLRALRRPPSVIAPLPGIPDVIDFPRDIQPVLDRHCVSCHDAGRRAGRVVLSGDRGPVYSTSYFTLTALGYVSDGRDRVGGNTAPRTIGTSASPLLKYLGGAHHDARLTAGEAALIRAWIESSATYPGTYAALDCGMIGGYPHSQLDRMEGKWPESVAAAEAIARRCAACHGKPMPLPRSLSDDMGLVLQNPKDDDPRIRWSRHLMFNLTRPAQSLMLLAPLAKAAGGFGRCQDAQGAPVFASAGDPDFQKILAMCQAGGRELGRIKRFDMAGFIPAAPYVREMKRFGILPATYDGKTPIDIYALDQAYWRSHWWQPRESAKKEKTPLLAGARRQSPAQ